MKLCKPDTRGQLEKMKTPKEQRNPRRSDLKIPILGGKSMRQAGIYMPWV